MGLIHLWYLFFSSPLNSYGFLESWNVPENRASFPQHELIASRYFVAGVSKPSPRGWWSGWVFCPHGPSGSPGERAVYLVAQRNLGVSQPSRPEFQHACFQEMPILKVNHLLARKSRWHFWNASDWDQDTKTTLSLSHITHAAISMR